MAFIYEPCRTSPLKLKCVHDPDAKVYYSFRYRAPAWSAVTEKREKSGLDEVADIVRPSTPNGFYYEVASGGITGTQEPTWITEVGESVIDGDVEYVARVDDLFLRAGDAISSSVWTSDVGVVLDNDAISGFDTYVRVTDVPVDISSFTLQNTFEVSRVDGKVEEFNRSLKIKIKDQ